MDNLRIRKYMDQLFENAPVNHRTLEFKEELIANALEKYNDMVLRGYGEDEAFQLVVGSIGDVQQLFQEMGTSRETGTIQISRASPIPSRFRFCPPI